MRRLPPAACCLLFIVLQASPALAGDVLEEVIVTATRIPTARDDLPFAASAVGRDELQRARQQLGLDEALAGVPGLFFQNRYNFAQDLRISIRGFGARADFGIRGVRIYADDIPLTLPDGQGSVDAIDLGSAEQVEVLRGPFSAVYGPGSGGVINIRTEDGPEKPTLTGRLNAGAYGYHQWQAKAGGQSGRLNWLANTSSTRLDGYRQNSAFENTLFNGKFRYAVDAHDVLTVVVNAVDSPVADDPGALTVAEADADPRAAAPRNLAFRAGESLDQQTLGLSFRRQSSERRELMLRAYYVRRGFQNFLPFDVNSNGQGGSVDLQRDFAGMGASHRWTMGVAGRDNQLVAGFDYESQRDHRRRYANNLGVIGRLTTDQDEDVTSAGFYLQDVLDWTTRLSLTLGARFDRLRYEVTDRTGAGGSGGRWFTEFSPMAGLNWAIRDSVRLYGNVSTSFDPPATTELANPYGPTGFNPDLDSQRATNYELGVKGRVGGRFHYEAALFHIDVRDEIVPFELEGSGQTFYENAGSSTHRGLEASVSAEVLPGLVALGSYTWSDFSFDRFRGSAGEVYDGNRIPGVPEHLFQAGLTWSRPSGFYAGLDFLYAGSFYADNANQVPTKAYRVADLRAGYRLQSDGWTLEPFAGINNLFAERYMSNIRSNASFGRYYEPAPGRNAYAGISLSYAFL
ncbi:MAG: TonB-dependent receptor [Lysobacterales bacterium]